MAVHPLFNAILHHHLGGPKPRPTNAELADELEKIADDEMSAMQADVLVLAAERLRERAS